MKRILFTVISFLFVMKGQAYVENDYLVKDSTKVKSIMLDEFVVINPKSNTRQFEFPGAITTIGSRQLENSRIQSLKELSSLAPNFYIPDYGSRLTSAIYIRGIGSRINSPAVGLSVDNVPYMDKSTFDFDLMDIEKIEILRGPQGTLYGRNTMAGLVNIYTKSPFDNAGTRFKIGYGNYNALEAALTHNQKISEKFAFSIGGRYKGRDGYFKNEYTGKRADDSDMAGGRISLNWRPSLRLRINLSSDFDYSDQNGYAYFRYDKTNDTEGAVNYNDRSGYKRKLSSNSLFIQYIHDRFVMSSTTGYQYFKDRMDLDQDFTADEIFTLTQKQYQHSITQELVFRSTTSKRVQWVAGVFGFYQGLKTEAPVNFKKDGVNLLINSMIQQMMPPGAPVQVTVDSPMLIDGSYKTPSYGLAIFKQATVNRLFTDGLSATVGLRLNYEHMKLNHNTGTTAVVRVKVPAMPFPMSREIPIVESGKETMDSWELLPRFELKYKINTDAFVYASVARGFRSGGYNIQMFSDIIQAELKNKLMGMGSSMAGNSQMPPVVSNSSNLKDVIAYKPEHSWNYEIGYRMDLLKKRLSVDLTAFYIDCRNQQIAEFADNGYGRQTKNTGKTTSKGVELSLRASVVKDFMLTASYGYTHATFKDYEVQGKAGELVSYKGKFVPFAPLHTLSLTADYVLRFNDLWLDNIRFGAQYIGKGKIYWLEQNDASQNFYGLLNAEIGLNKNNIEWSFWGKNLTNVSYHSFYFETLNARNIRTSNGFAEKGRPITFGTTLICKF